MIVVNVGEPRELALKWTSKFPFNFPVVLDTNSAVAESYCQPGYHGDLPRNQVAIASNLIVDPEGLIRFNLQLDSKHFDAKLLKLKKKLDQLLAEKKP